MTTSNQTTPSPAYLVGSLLLPEGHSSLVEYGKACHPIFQAYGAEALVVGTSSQQVEVLEGEWHDKDAKLSVIRFPSMQHLKDCLASDDYQAIKHLREDAVQSHFSLAID